MIYDLLYSLYYVRFAEECQVVVRCDRTKVLYLYPAPASYCGAIVLDRDGPIYI